MRSRTTSETRGFIKAPVEAVGDRIVGFTILGAEASKVMAVVQTAIMAAMLHTGSRDAIITPDQGRGPRLALLECAGSIGLAEDNGTA